LLSTLCVYWHELVRLLSADRRVIGLMAVGTFPAAAVGLALKRGGLVEPVLESAVLAGAMLPLTGLLLVWAARRPPGLTAYQSLSYPAALTVGVFQATALLPGISRSGTTIAAGLGVSLRRQDAATFSFLLAVPAVGGACLLELIDVVRAGRTATPIDMLVVGAVISFVVGLVALRWLLQWLESGRLHYFAYWVVPLGLAVIVWQLAA
jgi:undecaprenyl-diphosphatase